MNDYVEMMKKIFDFKALRRLFAEGALKVLIDSMHGGEFLSSLIFIFFFLSLSTKQGVFCDWLCVCMYAGMPL